MFSASLPVPLALSHSYLIDPVQLVLRRCSEHGLYQALVSSVNHSLVLDFDHKTVERVDNGSSSGITTVAVLWLAIGWAISLAVYLFEFLLGLSYLKKIAFKARDSCLRRTSKH